MNAFTSWERLLLSGVAGAVDGIGYVLLHVFTAHITGNTVHLGTDAGRLDLASAWKPALAIAAFVAGVAAGALTRESCTRRGIPPRPVVASVTGLLLVVFLAVGLAGPRTAVVRFVALAVPAAMAMGCMNAVMPVVGGRRVKTYITGTMTEFAEAAVAAVIASARERARFARRAAGQLGLWSTYLAGGAVSGFTGARWGVVAALLPIGGVAAVVCVEAWRMRGGAAMESRNVT